MKKILCLIESLGSGGAERQITGLAAMLKKQGHEVEVWYYVKKEFYLQYLEENGVAARYISNANVSHKRFFILNKHINDYDPDTVISYSVSTNMITSVMKILGSRFNLIVSERNTSQKLTFREKLKFFFYQWANHIVPNSFSQQNFINQNFPRLTAKVKVITNFVDMDKFAPSTYTSNITNNTNIVCVGRMMHQKNILNFIQAIAKLVERGNKISVDWYGQNLNDEYSKSCTQLITDYNLHECFVFHAPSLNIQEVYRKADVFCLPSLYEGFPNVLCEAMSCGKPVLCSSVCDNPNIVRDGQNGLLFDPLNIDEIVAKVEQYLSLTNEEKVLMGHTSRDIALGMFSKDAFILKYNEII